MSFFTANHRRQMLSVLGSVAYLERGGEIRVMKPRFATAQREYGGDGFVESVNPIARADYEEVTRHGLACGENGDRIRIGGIRYKILSIEPERNGFCWLELGIQ